MCLWGKGVLVTQIPLAKDTSLSPMLLALLPSPCGPTTPCTFSLNVALKMPMTVWCMHEAVCPGHHAFKITIEMVLVLCATMVGI